MLDEHLDPLIDDVAREMTAAPPDAQFARRVSMRIAEAGENRRGWRRPWVLVPVASASALILAVFVTRESSVRLKPDATTNGTTNGTMNAATNPAPAAG